MNKTNEVTCRLEKLEHNVLDMLTSFNFLLKSKGLTVDELMAEGNVGSQDKVTIRQIVVPFLKAYKKKLSEEDMIDFMDDDPITESERCPKCKCGRLQTVYRGVAVNGNPYSVIRCSNEKLGCDYGETKFMNLV